VWGAQTIVCLRRVRHFMRRAHSRKLFYKLRMLHQFSMWENVNLGEPKEGTLGKGLVPFGEGMMGWETHEKVQDFYATWVNIGFTKRGDPWETAG
jgi:hypothetical protein